MQLEATIYPVRESVDDSDGLMAVIMGFYVLTNLSELAWPGRLPSSEQQSFQQGKLPSIRFLMTGKARKMGCSVPPSSQRKTFQFNSNDSALENGNCVSCFIPVYRLSAGHSLLNAPDQLGTDARRLADPALGIARWAQKMPSSPFDQLICPQGDTFYSFKILCLHLHELVYFKDQGIFYSYKPSYLLKILSIG